VVQKGVGREVLVVQKGEHRDVREDREDQVVHQDPETGLLLRKSGLYSLIIKSPFGYTWPLGELRKGVGRHTKKS
jgi:hypothetical protein